MALFKILKGESTRIDTGTTKFNEGYAYFTPDDAGFYIDATVGKQQKRIRINSADSVRFDDGTTFQQKLDSGELKGDRGETGAAGAPGKDGAAGATGPAGPTGAKGDTGDTWVPSVDASTGNLSWTKNGSGTPQTVNIKGPKGDTGTAGAAGAKGETGAKGADGVSPTVSVSKSGKTTTVTFTDAAGEKKATILDGTDGATGPTGPAGPTGAAGANGKDGVSPTVKTSKSGTVTTVTITDASGAHSFEINDGANGANGKDGAAGATGPAGPTGAKGDTGDTWVPSVDASTGNLSWTKNSGTEPQTVNIKGPQGATGPQGAAGSPGKDGAAGKDGVSPTVTTSKSGSVTTVTITDASGAHKFDIKDGANGANGKDGAAGATGPTGPAGPAPTVNAAAGANINVPGTPSVTASQSGSTVTLTFNNLKGATGAQGATGPAGPAGATGSTGPTGPKGDQGAKGDPGTTPKVSATLPVSGWVDTTDTDFKTAGYTKMYTLTASGATAADGAACRFTAASLKAANACGMCATVNVVSGAIRFYAAVVPAQALALEYQLIKG